MACETPKRTPEDDPGAEDRIAALLLHWEERREAGDECVAADLCCECPELIPELQKRVEALRSLGWIDENSGSSPTWRGAASGASTSNPGRASTAAPALLPGDRLGNYDIVERLGSGGMGEVYKAVHRKMRRAVAVKILPPWIARRAGAVGRFQQGIRTLASMVHPNIVRAYDADEAGATHFLVMEYIEGEDLASFVKSHGPLKLADAVDCILQAARGLAYAHERGVIHRDVKPSNLLRDRGGTVKVLDMGLARCRDFVNGAHESPPGASGGEDEGVTGHGAVFGTVDFMSPEQALDPRAVDERSDVYSLGCTLFYLLTGRAPFRRDTSVNTLLAHRDEPRPSLGLTGREALAAEATFRRMVAASPGARQSSMRQVLDELELVVAKKRTSSTAPWRWRLAMAAALCLAVVALAALMLKFRTRDGTIVVEVSEPGARVEFFDAENRLELTRLGHEQTLSISIEPGKHRLKVEKPGFQVFTREFSLKSGDRETVVVRLDPLPKPPSVNGGLDQAAAEWVLSVGGDVTVLDGTEERKIAGLAQLPSSGFQLIEARLWNKTAGEVGDLSRLVGLSHLRAISLWLTPVDAAMMRNAAQIRALRDLDLRGTRANAATVAEIVRLPLKRLLLIDTDLTENALLELGRLESLEELGLEGLPATDRVLSRLGGLKSLRKLYLSGTPVTDQGLANLREMNQLSFLHLNYTAIGDEGVRRISEMPSVEFLFLVGTKVSDESAASLGRLPKLSHLEVALTPLSGEGVAQIAARTSLKSLGVDARQLTNKAIDALRASTTFERLLLSFGEGATDDDVRRLTSAPRLTDVTIEANSRITDAALDALGEISALTNIFVRSPLVTDAGIERLRQKLPRCQVQR